MTVASQLCIGRSNRFAPAVEYVAAARLQCVTGARSFGEDPPERQAGRRVSFGRYLASLDEALSVEFRTISTPSTSGATADVALVVILRATSRNGDPDSESKLRRSFEGMLPVIRAHFPEGEFTSCNTAGDLDAALAMPGARDGWRFDHETLEIPLGPGLPKPRTAVGFGKPTLEAAAASEAISMVIPWVPPGSDWRRLAEILAWSPTPLVLRAIARSVSLPGSPAEAELTATLGRVESVAEARTGGTVSKYDSELLRTRVFERRNSLYQGALRIDAGLFSPEPIPREIATAVALELSGDPAPSRDPFATAAGAISCRPVKAADFEDRAFGGGAVALSELFTAVEASGVLRLPSSPTGALDGFHVRHSRTSVVQTTSADPEPGSILLGVNAHRGLEVPVHLSPQERRRHVYVVGQTGTGKSTLLERMILQDIRGGRGCAVIDPHGDLIDNVLARMPRDRADDVIVLDFQEEERPIGLNPLRWTTLPERDFIVEEVLTSILGRYHSETTGPVFEVHARNFLKVLMGDAPREDYVPNLVDFPLLYQRKAFRRKLVETMADPVVVDFVREAESNTNSEYSLRSISTYITSKFARFIGSQTVQRVLGQSRSVLDFETVMNEGKIVLISLAKGRVGQLSADTLCSLLLTRFWAAAMKRASVPFDERRDFTLYVDEFHNVASATYAELLAEARKYRLGLVLANQFISQLPEKVVHSILGNVGCILSFRVGPNDADLLAKVFQPVFAAPDLVELPILHAYVSCLVGGGEVSRPFSVRCVRDEAVRDRAQAAEIREMSRQRWGTPAAEIDEEIRTRREWIASLEQEG
jgi:hypothetical protein